MIKQARFSDFTLKKHLQNKRKYLRIEKKKQVEALQSLNPNKQLMPMEDLFSKDLLNTNKLN